MEMRLEEIYQISVYCDKDGRVTVSVFAKKGSAGKLLHPGDYLIFEKVTESFPRYEGELL